MSDHFKNIFMKWNDHQWKILLRWSISYLMSSATETLRRHLQMWLTEGFLLLAVTWSSPFFLPNFWGLVILKKLNTETCIYNTKFGIVTFILYRILCPTKRTYFNKKMHWCHQCCEWHYMYMPKCYYTCDHTLSGQVKSVILRRVD